MLRKTKTLLALLLALTMLGGCGSVDENDHHGLVTEPDESESNPIRVEVPTDSDSTPDTTVRHEDDTTARPDTPSVVTPVDDSTVIKFLVAGDNIIHENVFLDARSRAKAGESYNFIDMYDGVADVIADADLAFINQETPVGGDSLGIVGYPNFNSPEAAGETLVELGFDIINVANNHMLDKGERSYKGSLEFWGSQPITMLGGYKNREDYENIRVVEKDGISIAFISYTYDTNNMKLPATSEMYIPYTDEAEVVAMTKKAREKADLVFVVMHWGQENENSHIPSASERRLAQSITDAGADVIIGMHPHVIQPIEWYTAPDETKTLVIFSVGSFISTQYNNRNLVGGLATFDIVKNKNGEISIENPLLDPIVIHYNMERLGLQVYRLEDYTEEMAKLHGTHVFGQSNTLKKWDLETIKSFVTKNVSAEFLPEFLH